MNRRSIGFRLTASYTALLALLLIVFSTATYLGLRNYLVSTLKESHARRAKEIGPLLAQVSGDEAAQIAEIASHYAPEADDGFLRFTRPDGDVLSVSGWPRDRNFDPSQVPLPPQNDSNRFERIEPLSSSRNLYISTFRIDIRDGGTLLMEIGSSDQYIRETHHRLSLILAISSPLVIIAAILIGYLLTRRALKPIDEITTKAEAITSRNLGERLPVAATGDEVERLSLGLNRMIERLEEAFHYLNRFSADASHELRTPLTILRGELESIAQRTDASEEVRDRISSALEEADRLTKITESLLTVARLDAGEIEFDRDRIDLAQLAFSTAEQMRLLADDKHISLNCRGEQKVEVYGDASRLKQVIVNLLDNAVKYTEPGGTVNISVSRDHGNAILEIADTGVGIQKDSLLHIFERFYRADESRTRKHGGVGLGLSIVKSIAKSHAGDITVESAEGKGSCFRVQLPLISN